MKSVVVLSGGLDSTVLLAKHIRSGHKVRAISVNYGQRHRIELDYARHTCAVYGVPLTIVDLSSLAAALPGSSQTDTTVAVPKGHYAEETMKATVVPNRNMILLSVALGHAVAHKFDCVSYAAHSGDHAIYPDCREEFVAALDKAAGLCDWHPVRIERPFVGVTKAEIVALGNQLDVALDRTYSCYEGLSVHCGTCGTCIERREAFLLAGVPDPTAYRDTTSIQTRLENLKQNS